MILTSSMWNFNKVLGFRMTASSGIRLAGTNSDSRPKTKRSNEFRFGARRRARLPISNWCFSNKDLATTTRTPPGRRSLAMVASRWTAIGVGESPTGTVSRCLDLTRLLAPLYFCRGFTNSPGTGITGDDFHPADLLPVECQLGMPTYTIVIDARRSPQLNPLNLNVNHRD